VEVDVAETLTVDQQTIRGLRKPQGVELGDMDPVRVVELGDMDPVRVVQWVPIPDQSNVPGHMAMVMCAQRAPTQSVASTSIPQKLAAAVSIWTLM
jgi:hypothetical protein